MTPKYALYTTGKLFDRFALESGLPKGVKPRYNINPTMPAPVIINRDDKRAVEVMTWGLLAKGTTDLNAIFRYKTYATPSGKLLTSHSRESAARTTRCLVPVNGFYDIIQEGDVTTAHYTHLADHEVFAIAGIYRSWEDEAGVTQGSFSMITSEITPGDSEGGRMPAIIKPDDEATWLDPSFEDANTIYGMLKPYPAGLLVTDKVSIDVKSSKIDKPALITPIA